MITSVKVKSGFAARLPDLKDSSFSFTEGVNVLVGPNACGKSTLLKVIAGHTGTDTRAPSDENTSPNLKEIMFPQHCKHNTVGGVEADLGWDGYPCLLYSATENESKRGNPYTLLSAMESLSGAEDLMGALAMAKAVDSDGQYQLRSLDRLVQRLRLFRFTAASQTSYKDPVIADLFMQHTIELQRNASEKARPINTVLMDEPDRSLNITNTIAFWNNISGLAEKLRLQLIVASHSFVPVFLKSRFNIIDVVKGYSATVRNAITDLVVSTEK